MFLEFIQKVAKTALKNCLQTKIQVQMWWKTFEFFFSKFGKFFLQKTKEYATSFFAFVLDLAPKTRGWDE